MFSGEETADLIEEFLRRRDFGLGPLAAESVLGRQDQLGLVPRGRQGLGQVAPNRQVSPVGERRMRRDDGNASHGQRTSAGVTRTPR